MKVKEVMSKELIVGYVPGTIRDAMSILAKHDVSGMPVLKKNTKTVIGVVTRNDIFKNPNEEQLALIMSQNPVLINKDKDLLDAAKLLYEKRIHGLPVTDRRGNLVGIISPTEILKALPNEYDDVVEHYYTSNLVPVYQNTPITINLVIYTIL